MSLWHRGKVLKKHMTYQTTAQALEAITDEGLFELLASAVLRRAHPLCSGLLHPGINASGKTVKSPLDGIYFVPNADPPHLIAVHHTTTASNGLEAKWLHNPTLVKTRKGTKPSAPPGDLIKTSEIVTEERKRIPNLQATLFLTTNREPGEVLLRNVHAEGHKHGVTIEIWSRSLLCDFLDHDPTGQWIRADFLGIEQELLSPDLLHKLSLDSLRQIQTYESPELWVDRALDTTLKRTQHRDVTFLVADSGLGKSVACYRLLAAHVENGGFGLVLSHDTINAAASIEQAVMNELRRLHSRLSSFGPSAFEFCSPDNPLLLIVEDINQLGQNAPRLAEKLASWSRVANRSGEGGAPASPWRLVCPVWPQSLSAVREQARKRVDQLCEMAKGFSEQEGTDAVLVRRRLPGYSLSRLQAQEIASALDYDPLLIALHDPNKKTEPNLIIAQYIESSLERVSADDPAHMLTDYGQALRSLAAEMLLRRQFELNWSEVQSWFSARKELSSLLVRIASKRELLRLEGASTAQRLIFRHDRVREWLLAEGIIDLHRIGRLSDDIVVEPYFAEVLGAALAHSDAWENMLERVAPANPLALFHAFRLTAPVKDARQQRILQQITAWLNSPGMRTRANAHLRWEALATLARTDSADVPTLVRMFPDRTHTGQLARFRNSDFSGGIELCRSVEPGEGAPWRDVQIEHAKLRYGEKIAEAVAKVLRQPDIENSVRVGALRLAGHLASPALAEAIDVCWKNDQERVNSLAEYLWAFAECCGDEPAQYLGPVCDAWAALPNKAEREGFSSPRDELAAHNLRWAFRKWPPLSAIDYFIARAQKDELRWPITYMLHEVDHPATVLFVAQELAEIQRTGRMAFLDDHWRRAQENGYPMSKASRSALLALWQNSGRDKHLRAASFSLWAATTYTDDLAVLQTVASSDDLFGQALAQRLTRGDQSAIPEMIKKLDGQSADHWWLYGRQVWSTELTSALDAHLARRGGRPEARWGDTCNVDYFMSELIIRLPPGEAETLLLKHWSHLRFNPLFVQAALYAATLRLQELVAATVNEASDPARLFEHLTMHWGCRTVGHPGVTKQDQIRALSSYFHLLKPQEIREIWHACNKNEWFELRRELIDKFMPPNGPFGWWHPDKMMTILDETLQKSHSYWLHHRVDDFLKADVAWDDIFTSMVEWLEQRHSLEALEVAASVLAHKGTRKDLAILKCCEDLGDTAVETIADTTFAVYRRSLC